MLNPCHSGEYRHTVCVAGRGTEYLTPFTERTRRRCDVVGLFRMFWECGGWRARAAAGGARPQASVRSPSSASSIPRRQCRSLGRVRGRERSRSCTGPTNTAPDPLLAGFSALQWRPTPRSCWPFARHCSVLNENGEGHSPRTTLRNCRPRRPVAVQPRDPPHRIRRCRGDDAALRPV